MNSTTRASDEGQNNSGVGKSAAMQKLSEHKLAKIEVRTLRDRFPRRIGRNAKGKPAGRGGSYRIRILTTDKGVSGWAMSWMPDVPGFGLSLE